MNTLKSLLMEKKYLTFGLLCLSLHLIDAQEVPTVIQPAPETAALFRYQEYPVDYSTGLPQISIPLYEVKNGDLSIPISISYHASGCRVSDQDGPIAVGWSLNAGGMISRTVKGSPDFGGGATRNYPFPDPFITNGINPNGNLDDLAYVERITHFDKNPDLVTQVDWLDGEYDIFSYSFGGNSGKFIFKDEGGIKTPILLPYKPFNITPNIGYHSLGSIDVLDDKGVLYSFEGTESYSTPEIGTARTAYTIKEILSANKTDTITFGYQTFNQKRLSIDQNIVLEDSFANFPNDANYQINHTLNQSNNLQQYNISRLTEIDFGLGKVWIHLVDEDDLIEYIEITDNHGNTIRTIEFFRSLLHSLSEVAYTTHSLDRIVIKDKTGNAIEEYSFEYYPTSYVGGSNQINVRHKDWWGYYNASGEHEMVPRHENLQVQNPTYVSNEYGLGNVNADREPDLDALKSGVLKQIIYPTGGTTEFVYEHNKYQSLFTGEIKDGPGLRIAQIITNDQNGTTHTKTFKYGIEESGYSFIDMEPYLGYMKDVYRYDFFFGNQYYRHRIFYSGFIPQLQEIAQRPIIYTEVAVYNGTPYDNIGKTIYNYDRIPWAPSGLGGTQKLHIYDYNYWNNASLQKKTDFVNLDESNYQKRKETINSYVVNTSEYIYGLHIQRNHIFPETDRVFPGGPYAESYAVDVVGLPVYQYGEYRIPVGIKNLTSTTEIEYHENGSEISKVTNYTYNDHQLISQTSHSTSDGETLDRQIKYPFDDVSGDPVLNQMTAADINMLNYPIEQTEVRNDLHTKSTQTLYDIWENPNSLIVPHIVGTKKGEDAYEPRLQFHEYNSKGRLLEASKENGTHISYIWGYQDQYPIAKIENANYAEVEPYVDNLKTKSNNDDDRTIGYTGNEGALRQDLDALRQALQEALITTYTYDPLIGITSITDPRGYTIYYHYDDFNRLEFVKDAEGNLVSENKYHYKEQSN